MKPQFAAYLDRLNSYYQMGNVVVTGAYAAGGASTTSVRKALSIFDKDTTDHDAMLYQWSINTYGPGGMLNEKPVEGENTVGAEQLLFKGYADFRARWTKFKEAKEHELEVAEGLGGTALERAEKDFTDLMLNDLERFRIEFKSWQDKTKAVFDAHGNPKKAAQIEKTLPGGLAKTSDIPWGTILIAGAAAALVGGLWYLGRKAKAEEAAASSRRTITMRGASPTIVMPPAVVPMGPPPPLPTLNLGYGSK